MAAMHCFVTFRTEPSYFPAVQLHAHISLDIAVSGGASDFADTQDLFGARRCSQLRMTNHFETKKESLLARAWRGPWAGTKARCRSFWSTSANSPSAVYQPNLIEHSVSAKNSLVVELSGNL